MIASLPVRERRAASSRPEIAVGLSETPGSVMKCHVLPCDVMSRRKCRPCPGPMSSCMRRSALLSRNRSQSPACGSPRRNAPVFSRVSRVGARAFRAGVRYARQIARTREANAGRTSPVRSQHGLALLSLSGIEKAAPEAASLSSAYHAVPSVKPRAGRSTPSPWRTTRRRGANPGSGRTPDPS